MLFLATGFDQFVEDLQHAVPVGLGQLLVQEFGELGEDADELIAGEDVCRAACEVVGISAFQQPGGGPPIALSFSRPGRRGNVGRRGWGQGVRGRAWWM